MNFFLDVLNKYNSEQVISETPQHINYNLMELAR